MPLVFRKGDPVRTESGETGEVLGWRVCLEGGKWFFFYEVETPSGTFEAREDLLILPEDLIEARLEAEETRKKESARAAEYNASIVSIQYTHDDLAVFRVKPDGAKATYKPGQYTTLGLLGFESRLEGTQKEEPPTDGTTMVRRAYSISHRILDDETGELVPSGQDDFYEFYIVLVRDNGEGNPAPGLTPRLFALKEGNRLQIGKKATGHYTSELMGENTKTVILGGTGTGEAPHMSMISQLLSDGFEGDIVCIEVARFRHDFGYLATHKKLMGRYPNYHYVGLSTRDPDIEKKVYIQGYIGDGMLDELLGYTPEVETTHWFFCGNPKMLGVPQTDKETGVESYPTPLGVIEVLEGLGHTADRGRKNPGNIHYEEYW
ncbi:ferredoxin--NADP reductase [bacterium]|nr:ferredoxin--NADP reductase [bacterium]